jgi:hypothetical protein
MNLRTVGLTLLAVASGCFEPAAPSPEYLAREAFVEELSIREGLVDRWRLMSRGDVIFEEGFTRPFLIEIAADGSVTELTRSVATTRGVPIRWMSPRAHMRLRGSGAMTLHLWGHADVEAIFSRPRLSANLDGREVASALVNPDGAFDLVVTVDSDPRPRWRDLYLEASTVGEWRLYSTDKVVRLEGVTWESGR